jgi:hypothetical protein
MYRPCNSRRQTSVERPRFSSSGFKVTEVVCMCVCSSTHVFQQDSIWGCSRFMIFMEFRKQTDLPGNIVHISSAFTMVCPMFRKYYCCYGHSVATFSGIMHVAHVRYRVQVKRIVRTQTGLVSYRQPKLNDLLLDEEMEICTLRTCTIYYPI